MRDLGQQQRLAALRSSIADIERRPTLVATSSESGPPVKGGLGIAASGVLQEIFTDGHRNSGAALGFALAQARGLLTAGRQVVVYLQLLSEAQEMGVPYGPGLASFGFDPDALVLIRPFNMVELLWAAEEALACQAVAAVVADIAGQPKILNFTASRRLALRTAAAGVSLMLLRYGDWREATASQLRWHLKPMRSGETPFDAKAPGATRWLARLEKGNIGGEQNRDWLLEWTEHGFEQVDGARAQPDQPAVGTTLPGALPAQLGNRLRQTA